jgi:hypothetical protein
MIDEQARRGAHRRAVRGRKREHRLAERDEIERHSGLTSWIF